MKQVNIQLDIPITSYEKGRRVFHALYSIDGATHLPFIKHYNKYSIEPVSSGILKIDNEYKTLFGKVSQSLRVLGNTKLFFQGSGPLGIRFEGCWTLFPSRLHLDQTIECPGALCGRVRSKVRSIATQIERTIT